MVALTETSSALIDVLMDAGNKWGPLGVAVAAAQMTDLDALMRQLEAMRWQAGVESAVCFIDTCDYDDIGPRGPVFLRGDKTPHYACTEHWEAIIGILGRQVGSDDEHRPFVESASVSLTEPEGH